GICRWRNIETKEFAEYGLNGRDADWLSKHGWYCDIEILKKLLSCIREDKDVFVAGITENIEEVFKCFDRVYVLNANDEVIKDRLNKRSNNHFAQKEDEQDFILVQSRSLMNKLDGAIQIDASKTPAEVTQAIL